jgi:hypothetical protein
MYSNMLENEVYTIAAYKLFILLRRWAYFIIILP